MRHTLRALADRGVRSARLATDQENPHNSVGLYERAGYTVASRQPRYRKPAALDPVRRYPETSCRTPVTGPLDRLWNLVTRGRPVAR